MNLQIQETFFRFIFDIVSSVTAKFNLTARLNELWIFEATWQKIQYLLRRRGRSMMERGGSWLSSLRKEDTRNSLCMEPRAFDGGGRTNCKGLCPGSPWENVLHQGSEQRSESMYSCMKNVPSKVVGCCCPLLVELAHLPACYHTRCSAFKWPFRLTLDHGLVPCTWSLGFGVWGHALHTTMSSDGQGKKIEVVPLLFDIGGSWWPLGRCIPCTRTWWWRPSENLDHYLKALQPLGRGNFLPGMDCKGNKYFYSYNALNDSNQKRPCDLLSRPKQVNNHLFREQKVKGRQGCEILGWKNRPFIMKDSGQRTLRRHTRREGVSLSDTKSDVLYHMETIAQSCVKASVSVHGNWIVLTLQGFNALMLWGSLVVSLLVRAPCNTQTATCIAHLIRILQQQPGSSLWSKKCWSSCLMPLCW